jgi:hypothetical protein
MSAAFSITAAPTDPESPLGLSVWLNDSVLFDTDRLTATQTISADVSDEVEDIEYTVKIVLKNKTAAHTKVVESGEIVKDSMIAISNIKLDDIEIDQVFFDQSCYTHSHNGNDEPVQDRFYGNMGCNGVVEFKFSTPVYIWLLENM